MKEKSLSKNHVRTAICRIISDMLDHPSANGIYPTENCYDRLERLIDSLMVLPESMQLTGSEAVIGFASMMTILEDPIIGGGEHDAAPWAELAKEFCDRHGLNEPRPGWDEILVPKISSKEPAG